VRRSKFLSISVFLILFAGAAAADQAVRKAEDITCAEAHTLIRAHEDDEDFMIIDFRPLEMFRPAYLRNAVFYDIFRESAEARLDRLDRDGTYLIYCTIGHRSGIALDRMKAMGFERVHHMYEGILAWKRLGYETLSFVEAPAG